jgi:phospholipase C
MNRGAHAVAALSGEPGIASPLPREHPPGFLPVAASRLVTGLYRASCRDASGLAVLMSTRRHHVSHVLHDHTSVLALLERKWNLPALTYRDANANANDLTDFLDLGAMAARRPTFATLPPLAAPGDTAAALACSTGGPGTIPPPGTVTG